MIEIINDDTNEEIEGEERAKDDKYDKVDVHVEVLLIDRLVFHLLICRNMLTYILNRKMEDRAKAAEAHLSRIYCCVHNVHPTFKGGL